MKKASYLIPLFISLVFIFGACKKPTATNNNPSVVNGFDKTAMLVNYADNLIIPGYASLQQKIADLKVASDAFLAAPSTSTQATVLTAYLAAHKQYEVVAAYNFGPAETRLLDLFLNYSGGLDYSFATAGQLTGFSVDSASIEANILAGSYSLTTMDRKTFYSQGFPALGYLYFEADAVAKLTTAATARKKYVNDVLDRMKSLVDQVATDWGTYRAEFIANTKTNTGSPIGNLVNQFAYQLDLLKGPRIGWPFGKQSNGIVFAGKCESIFTGASVALAVENLKALKNTYSGGTGKGMAGYLIALNQTALNTDVLAQFDLAIAKLQAIPDPLSTSLTAQPAQVDAAYKEIQKLLTLLKTDVASATAVQITFMDNDGD